MLIVQQAIGQICEALVPYLMYKRSKKQIKKHFCHDKSTCDDSEKSGVERVLNTDEVAEHVLLQAEIESAKPTYDVSIDMHGNALYQCIEVVVY